MADPPSEEDGTSVQLTVTVPLSVLGTPRTGATGLTSTVMGALSDARSNPPPYVAATWSTPACSAVVVSVAVSGLVPDRVAVPSGTPFWVKVTVPVGVPPDGPACTVAVKVTGAP